MNVQDAIRKNLSQEVSLTLRKRLEEADRILEENTLLKDRLDVALAEIEEHTSIQTTRRHLKMDREELEKMREEVFRERRNQEVNKLKHELSIAHETQNFVTGICRSLVRNTEFRREIYSSGSDPKGPSNENKTISEEAL
jgi:hypothetical protein